MPAGRSSPSDRGAGGGTAPRPTAVRPRGGAGTPSGPCPRLCETAESPPAAQSQSVADSPSTRCVHAGAVEGGTAFEEMATCKTGHCHRVSGSISAATSTSLLYHGKGHDRRRRCKLVQRRLSFQPSAPSISAAGSPKSGNSSSPRPSIKSLKRSISCANRSVEPRCAARAARMSAIRARCSARVGG
jgi:hypothetical protein